MGGSVGRSSRRWWLSTITVAVLLLPILGTPIHADELDLVLGDSGETYPDLSPEVTEVYIEREFLGFDPEGGFLFGPPTLFFDTWSQNLGTVAVDLIADDPTDFLSSTVSQCVSWRSPLVCRERDQVGGFIWHDEHTHFHYQDFASYELRRIKRNGRVDYSRRGLLDTSDKVSFCFIDSVQQRDDATPVPTYETCTPGREGISPGWADIYTADLDGQQLSLEGLSDGLYVLVITQNWASSLHEADYGNNRVEVIVKLSSDVNAVEIVDKRYP